MFEGKEAVPVSHSSPSTITGEQLYIPSASIMTHFYVSCAIAMQFSLTSLQSSRLHSDVPDRGLEFVFLASSDNHVVDFQDHSTQLRRQ